MSNTTTTEIFSTQEEHFQRQGITQCTVKTNLQSSQITMVKFSEDSAQTVSDLIICVESAAQHKYQYAHTES